MKVTQSCPTLWDPLDYTVHRILQARILTQLAWPLLQGIFPTQGSSPGLPHCRQILSQLSHQERKPKNTGVGSLSILQRIFLTQESNWDFLHCRQILYYLGYQGSPHVYTYTHKFTTKIRLFFNKIFEKLHLWWKFCLV